VALAEQLTVIGAGGVRLSAEQAGEGAPIVLLHGLTATRRYVVMGSKALERSGHRTIAYDARGHGHSSPAPSPEAYTYDLLAKDLAALLDELQIERAVLAGASMGAQTALRFALEHPSRVAALGLITPAFDPDAHGKGSVPEKHGKGFVAEEHGKSFAREGSGEGFAPGKQGEEDSYASWDRLARGLREGGVEGFIAAYDFNAVPERWHETLTIVLRQRLSAHDHPLAVADALQVVPRSRPFEHWEELQSVVVPTVVIASRDEADPTHPLAVGESYAAAIPGARLIVEEPGLSPIAWQGGQLSRVLAELSDSARR
jgi:pimeloyl-ACP methyl ester carboxylesterase